MAVSVGTCYFNHRFADKVTNPMAGAFTSSLLAHRRSSPIDPHLIEPTLIGDCRNAINTVDSWKANGEASAIT